MTRSDLLLALARLLGTDEPGTDVVLALPDRSLLPLARALCVAEELHVPIHHLIVTPPDSSHPRTASLQLGTIYPAPFLRRLEEARISLVHELPESEAAPASL